MAIPQDEVIVYSQPNIFGGRFRCSRRTAAWLDYIKEQLPEFCQLHIIQGCFNTSVSASAGTHDGDAVLDVYITGMSWEGMQLFLRRHGAFAWWRNPSQGFINHIHFGILGYRIRVGIFVPGQKADYLGSPPRNGLAGHAVDNTPHPHPQFVFSYTKYMNGDYGKPPRKPTEPKGDISMADADSLSKQIHAFREDFNAFRQNELKRDMKDAARDALILKRLSIVRDIANDAATPAEVRDRINRELSGIEDDLDQLKDSTDVGTGVTGDKPPTDG